MTRYEAYVAVFSYGGAIAIFCRMAATQKENAVVHIFNMKFSTKARLYFLLHNYRHPEWAILFILWISGIFLAVLSRRAITKKDFIPIDGGGSDPLLVAAALAIILIIAAVGFTWKGIRDFHDTREIAELPFTKLIPFLPARIEKKFGGLK